MFSPFFTGIPLHVSLLSEMQGMHEDFKQMQVELIESLKRELNSRFLGIDGYFDTQQMMKKINSFEINIMLKLSENLAVTPEEFL